MSHLDVQPPNRPERRPTVTAEERPEGVVRLGEHRSEAAERLPIVTAEERAARVAALLLRTSPLGGTQAHDLAVPTAASTKASVPPRLRRRRHVASASRIFVGASSAALTLSLVTLMSHADRVAAGGTSLPSVPSVVAAPSATPRFTPVAPLAGAVVPGAGAPPEPSAALALVGGDAEFVLTGSPPAGAVSTVTPTAVPSIAPVGGQATTGAAPISGTATPITQPNVATPVAAVPAPMAKAGAVAAVPSSATTPVPASAGVAPTAPPTRQAAAVGAQSAAPIAPTAPVAAALPATPSVTPTPAPVEPSAPAGQAAPVEAAPAPASLPAAPPEPAPAPIAVAPAPVTAPAPVVTAPPATAPPAPPVTTAGPSKPA